MAVWSKEVFAKNLKRYMEQRGVNQKELAEIIGVSAPTMHDYLKAKMYPRIDKIERLADYFGILKSDLIEDKGEKHFEMIEKSDTIASIALRMRYDEELLNAVEGLCKVSPEQLKAIQMMIDVFLKSDK